MKMPVAMMIRSLKILISHPHKGLEIRRIRANAEMTAPTSAFPTPKLGRTPAARGPGPRSPPRRRTRRGPARRPHEGANAAHRPVPARPPACPPGQSARSTRVGDSRSKPGGVEWDHRLGTGREYRHAARAALCRCSRRLPPMIMQPQRLQSQRRQPRLWWLPRTQLR